jgi:hypothetical protein
MKTIYFILTITIIGITSCSINKKPKVDIQGDLKKWHKVALVFDGVETSEWAKENPFLNYRLEVRFSNGNDSYIVPGFYAADGNAAESSADKGSVWKVYFRPDKVGEWSYKVLFRQGKDIAVSEDVTVGVPTIFDGYENSFNITETDKSGRDFRAKGRIVNGGNGYFKYLDSNAIFIKNGADSPENFLAFADFDQTARYENKVKRDGEANPDNLTHKYSAHKSDWKAGNPVWQGDKGKGIIGAINYLADQGVNSVYMVTLNIQGDGKDVWPYISHNDRYRFDCSKLDQWEIVFDHMESKGVMMHLVMQETENECLLDIGYTQVQRKLYLRELTARFGHHNGLIWNLGEENGPTNWSPIGQTDQQRKDMANYMKRVNPYNPIIFLHTHSNDQSQDEMLNPLLGFENLDGASMQIAKPHKVNERIIKWVYESTKKGKRWLVNMDEIGPHWKGVMPDSFDESHDTIRNNVLWGSLLAGSGGVEWYFGYRYPHTDLDCEDFRSRHNWWKQSTIATNFIGNFPIEQMKSSNNLINREDAYCLSKPNDVYLIYLPNASKNVILKLESDKELSIQWFNPRQGGDYIDGGTIKAKSKGYLEIPNPPSEPQKDWVAVIKEK